jgi:HD-like signal output (HDOD) protein
VSLDDLLHKLARPGVAPEVATLGIVRSLRALPPPLEAQSFWRLSLGTALSARQIALDFGRCEPDDAYRAGLALHLGEVYVARHSPERLHTGDPGAECELDVSPTEIAAELLAERGFPARVVDAVRLALRPTALGDGGELAGALFAADRICRDLGLGRGGFADGETPAIAELPGQLLAQIEAAGYPDVSFYLMEHRELLRDVPNFVRHALIV